MNGNEYLIQQLADFKKSFTLYLALAKNGEDEAINEVGPYIYKVLRAIAKRKSRSLKASLCTTDLMNDAFIKMFNSDSDDWKDKKHFFAVASLTMKRILIDRSRRRGLVTYSSELDSIAKKYEEEVGDIEALELALEELKIIDPKLETLIRLKFYGRMCWQDVADCMGISVRTAHREWKLGKAWLKERLR